MTGPIGSKTHHAANPEWQPNAALHLWGWLVGESYPEIMGELLPQWAPEMGVLCGARTGGCSNLEGGPAL